MITSKQDPHLKEVRRIVQDIDGLITDQEGECLYWLARNSFSEGVIVEIGSWKGKSTVWLAKGSEAGNKSKVYAIDTHEELSTELAFRENIRKADANEIIVPMIMKSEQATRGWKEPIKLLWIDGSHKYEDVKLDFLLWAPYLELGGTIAFHDWNEDGPRKVIEQDVLKSDKFSRMHLVDRIAFARKVEKCPRGEKLLKGGLWLIMRLLDLAPFVIRHKTLSPVRQVLSPFRRMLIRLTGRLM